MPRTFNSLSEFFEALPGVVDQAIKETATFTGERVKATAKLKMGTHQPGWPALHPSTIEERHEQGYTDDDAILKRTEALQDSIRYRTLPKAHGRTAVIGSDAPQARIQELGGPTAVGTYIPPRPYLAPAVVESEDAIQQFLALSIAAGIGRL